MIGRFLRNSFLHRPLQVLAHAYIIHRWKLNGRPLPPPAVLKQKVVKEYGRKHGFQTLIETGTAKGKMIRACKDHFQQIISIEFDPTLHLQAQQQFAPYSHITLLQGDSGEKLADAVQTLTEPALFWLDAHAMAGGIRPPQITPIIQELEHILSHTISTHVILIDDARLFTEESDYPTIAQLKTCLIENQGTSSFRIEVADDIIRLLPS